LSELPVLSKAQVVAGSRGLDRTIRWTHIIDHPDVIPWVQEGHLLLTTAFAIMLHPEEQFGLIHALNEKRLAGMMVNIGRYMQEIPAGMITAAEAAGFPLIALPWEVDFVEVTHAIHEHILQEQYALAEQADHIHQTLTRLVLEGGDLTELTRQMAEILHCSVTIEDASLRLLAYTNMGTTDEVRQRSIEQGKTPNEVVEFLRSRGVFEYLRKNPQPYHLSPAPEIGFTLERIVSPILVGAQLFGYIWIIASDQPLTGLDYLVIERGAVVAALILSREEAIYESGQRLKTQLFEGSFDLDASFPLDGLPQAAWQARLQNGYILLVIEADSPDRQSLRQLANLVEKHMKAEELWATVIERGRRLAVLVGTLEIARLCAVAESFAQAAQEKGYQIRVGVSAPSQRMDSLRLNYQQAIDALTVATALEKGNKQVWAYDDLGFLSNLLARSPDARVKNRYTDILQKIEQYDREKNTNYLLTLETYLDHLARPNQAARALFIHRNTLYQRLDKISELWGVDFQEPLVLLNLNLATKDWRLNRAR
jgi:purine catabolism regulator